MVTSALLALTLSGQAPAATAPVAAPAATSRPLATVVAAHLRAVQARDLPALTRTITAGDKLTLIFPDGRRSETRAEYLAFHREWFRQGPWTMAFTLVANVETADLAVFTYRTRYEEREGERVASFSENWLTLTFRRETGGWRLVHDQNTPIRRGP